MPDSKVRFCIDFWKLNAMSKTDTYPLPRVDKSIDKTGAATFITKIYLVKSYWQVLLMEKARQVASFLVSGAVYQCQVMPYRLKTPLPCFSNL